MADNLARETIRDFGDQWSQFPGNEGYYASTELFGSIVRPLLTPEEVNGAKVAEIGSGTGRIVNMLLDASVRRVYALEPSEAGFRALQENTKTRSDRVVYLNVTGDELPQGLELDYVFSIGVIQFIPKPDATIAACFKALKSGGKCLIWLYAKEGNETYLRFAIPLRKITVALPRWLLAGVCFLLNLLVDVYIGLCRYLPLPMRDYVRGHLAKLSRRQRCLTIHDQLNPSYAKYYSEVEARDVLARAGFTDVQTHHRLGYSWTVVGTKLK